MALSALLYLRADLRADDPQYTVEAVLAGLDRQDLVVDVKAGHNRVLTVQGDPDSVVRLLKRALLAAYDTAGAAAGPLDPAEHDATHRLFTITSATTVDDVADSLAASSGRPPTPDEVGAAVARHLAARRDREGVAS